MDGCGAQPSRLRAGVVLLGSAAVAGALAVACVHGLSAAATGVLAAHPVTADEHVTTTLSALVLGAATLVWGAWCGTLWRVWLSACQASESPAAATPWVRAAGVVLGMGGVVLASGPPTAAAERPPGVSAPGMSASCSAPLPFDSSRLDGLPLPGLPSTPGRRAVHVVAPGDSLWSIAAARLRPAAAPEAIEQTWRRWYARNRPVVGPDPDLLIPGQRLVPPGPPHQHLRSTR